MGDVRCATPAIFTALGGDPAGAAEWVVATVRADSYSAVASLSVQVRGLDAAQPDAWQTVALDAAGPAGPACWGSW